MMLMQLIRVPHDPEISQIQRPQIRRPSDLGTSDFGGVRFWDPPISRPDRIGQNLAKLAKTGPEPCQVQRPKCALSAANPDQGVIFGTPIWTPIWDPFWGPYWDRCTVELPPRGHSRNAHL